ncbi:MAG: hypothetical protein UT82_C0028G0019 [Parcubacteria group bacterium GW2011_GWB1_40_14]|nr:MAG: hypothetical protein UT82_C0028G0019 [Parcubacteria group bacterium GW2011_GWB1_40_14]
MRKEKKYNKYTAIKFLVENNEWQGAGMYEQIERIVKSPKLFYWEKDLRKMLKKNA